MAQHLEHRPLRPIPGQKGGQLNGIGPAPADAAAKPGSGPAVQRHMGVYVLGDWDFDRPGLGDRPLQQPVYFILGHVHAPSVFEPA